MSRFLSGLVGGFMLLAANVASAQLVIQQPVVSQFGVGTAVLVPDRGALFLGGVSYGAESRFFPGPGPCCCRGSSIGREFGSISLTTSVWIQDLGEMDRLVLEAAEEVAPVVHPRLEGRADAAFRLFARRPAVAKEPVPPMPPLEPVESDEQRKLNDPDRAWRLGQAAEANAKLGVAKLHYQHAARLGSVAAAARLKELGRR